EAEAAPIGGGSYHEYDKPTVIRQRGLPQDGGNANPDDPDYLDIPAFLRRQADCGGPTLALRGQRVASTSSGRTEVHAARSCSLDCAIICALRPRALYFYVSERTHGQTTQP